MLPTVCTREGAALPHEGAYAAELARWDEEIERLRALLHERER
jgi:hypothetical protein